MPGIPSKQTANSTFSVGPLLFDDIGARNSGEPVFTRGILKCCGSELQILQINVKIHSYRVCHGFRLRSKMIIFESILTFFKLSIVFRASWGSAVNCLEPKIDPPLENLS